MFRFEKLQAWQSAVDFADAVYQAASQFPTPEVDGLRSQLQNASISISANIAEGSGRASNNEFIRFVNMASGSLMEVVSELHIAKRRNLLTDEQFRDMHHRAGELSRLLNGLAARLAKAQKS